MVNKVITNSDLTKMQTMGRLVASKDDREALDTAAEYLAISVLEGSNFHQLWFWFEEGARNNVDGQYHLDGIQKRLKARADEILMAERGY